MTPRGREADPRDHRYLTFVTGRVQGWHDEEIAAECKCASAAQLYQRLSADGYPVCPTCGGAPVRTEHECAQKRRPRPGTGEGEDLPAASQASGLFEAALRRLLESVADLEYRQESVQDGRIVGRDLFEGSSVYFRRRGEFRDKVVESYSEDEWKELCARYEQDPELEGFWVDTDGLKRAAGATRHPAEPLTTLIAVYALAGGDMNELLEALYPGDPTYEVREAIRKRVDGKKKPDKMDGIRALAQQLATLARGQALVGAPRPSLTKMEHDAACFITMLREEGRSDEEILERLSNHRRADDARLSIADVRELGHLRLRYEAD